MNKNMDTMSQPDLQWEKTDPNQRIELAQYQGYRDTNPTPLIGSYQSIFESFIEPDEYRHTKEGPAFLIGPCKGKRSGENIPIGYVAVIDADKSINEMKETVDGAPHPVKVHEALVGWDISHCLYTTFRHGSEVGNRYRIIIPTTVRNREELQALTVYLTELLQAQAGLPLALSSESYVWGQGWNKPRVPYAGAEYLCRIHFGKTPRPDQLVKLYDFTPGRRHRMAPLKDSQEINIFSPSGVVEKFLPIPHLLEAAGYTYVSQSVMLNYQGEETIVFRYRRPGSTSAPGVVVFQAYGRWKAYSHHDKEKDPLNNGFANDALDVYRLINGFPDNGSALASLVSTLEEFTIDEMQRNHPTIMEGGYKFRFGNQYIDDFGALSYKLLDMQAFVSAMQNQPGVPMLSTSKDGEETEANAGGEAQVVMKGRAEYWRACRRRLLYNGIIYYPSPIMDEPELAVEKGTKLYFNAFRTWNVEARPGHWPLLEWHLRNTICGGHEEEYSYLLDWFAHLFQYPNEKPQVALVLQGGRGWGKTLLLAELARKMGTHAFIAGNNRLLTGNFNSHLRNKLFLVVEESFWSGSHKDRGVLQHIITDPVTGYEQKGVDAEAGISYLRVAMITNNDWAVPAGTDERRYFIPSICDASKQQKFRDIAAGNKQNHFFIRLLTELHNGGLEAFIHDMALHKFDRDSVRIVPETSKLMEQKEMSLDWIDKWLLEALREGTIHSKMYGVSLWSGTGCSIPHQSLKESLREATPQSVAYSDKSTTAMVINRMHSILGRTLVRSEGALDGSIHIFGDVSLCRVKFENYCGFPVQWAEA